MASSVELSIGAELLDDYFQEAGKSKQRLCHKMLVSRPRLDKILEHPETATVFQAKVLKEELFIRSVKDFDTIFLP